VPHDPAFHAAGTSSARDPALHAVATVFLKSRPGSSTRNRVQEKIRHNFAALGLRHLFRFFLALGYALSGWVTRALQGKVLVVTGVGPPAYVAGY
jgi:hypothetical protein